MEIAGEFGTQEMERRIFERPRGVRLLLGRIVRRSPWSMRDCRAVRRRIFLRRRRKPAAGRVGSSLGEKEFCAEVGQHSLHDVVFAGGDASGEQEQIGFRVRVRLVRGSIRRSRGRWGEFPGCRRRVSPARLMTRSSSCGSDECRGFSLASTISSPVVRMATRGR